MAQEVVKSLGQRLWSALSNEKVPNFTEKSILIAVMGMTGVGKTTFISKVTGIDMEIGHGLQSCTKDIQIATAHIDGYEVNLIDTPGFDDTELQDSDILIKICKYLMTGVRLSGILYLHPINIRRVGGVAKRNLDMFQNMVGRNNMRNIKLITTMWDSVKHEKGHIYLDELKQNFWNEMIAAGAQVDRCDDAANDGVRIIQSILKTSPVTLQLQKELEAGCDIGETAAGKVVAGQLDMLHNKYQSDMKQLREQLGKTARDAETFLRSMYEEKLMKQSEAAEQAKRLLEADNEKLKKEVEELRGNLCVIL